MSAYDLHKLPTQRHLSNAVFDANLNSRVPSGLFAHARARHAYIYLTIILRGRAGYLTIILRNRAEYHLILSRRGRRPSWLNQGIFRKIEQDNCFIIQQIPIDYHFQNEKNYGSMIKTLTASNT